MSLWKPIFLILCCWGIAACVEVYDTSFRFSSDVITVDGFVTNDAPVSVFLRRAKSAGRNYYADPLRNCQAEVRVSNGTTIKLTEFSSGYYVSAADFRGVAGQTYQLRFTTPEGQTYESQPELLNAAPPILKAYHEFNRNGFLDRTGTRPLYSSLDIYVDFADPPTQKNFYLWKWTDFEEQYVCASCEGGLLDAKTEQCIPQRNSRTIYDYRCNGNCWDIISSTDVNIFSDVFTNGRTVVARSVGKIPFYDLGTPFSNRASLVDVQQYAITGEAYEYYKLLRDQTQTTGSLTDTPPAPIIGNVRNVTDPNEKIVGYFAAAGLSSTRLFVDKRPYRPNALPALLLGRTVNLEPDSPPAPPLFEIRPPLATCVPSAIRTNRKPTGWLL
ncbi:MAG: DUF4249 domain-containing protein [Spirosomaceae bacterium]|nr:DUF4249 domain-containing protein [Spirosomataceae bacterium]